MTVYIIAWKTPDGWEWEAYTDEEGAYTAIQMRSLPDDARVYEVEVFDAVAAEIERQRPWLP
jgi:hypothetical protein